MLPINDLNHSKFAQNHFFWYHSLYCMKFALNKAKTDYIMNNYKFNPLEPGCAETTFRLGKMSTK